MKRHWLLVAAISGMSLTAWSQDIIIESYSDGLNNGNFSSVQGKWTESAGKSTAPGLTATKAVFNDANTDPAVARFTPDIPSAGKYEVFITYPVQGNATDVKYTVVSADGSKDIPITQNGRDFGHVPVANSWYSLGVYNFNAGTTGYVQVSDPLTGLKPLFNEPNARIYADAVKFVPSTGSGAVVAQAPSVDPVAAAPADLPPLPTPAAAPADMPGLPAVQAAATPAVEAMPNLPQTTSQTGLAAQLPGLPQAPPTISAAAKLPSLPGDTSAAAATGMPALPDTPVDPTAALPSLPTTAATPAVAGLPDLPAASTSAANAIVTAQVTPYPVPNLPSLAQVTPTPERTLPSPADTPVGGMPTGLPGGALSNLPPVPALTPAINPVPGAIPSTFAPTMAGAPAIPSAPTAAAAQPTPGGSITQYNPANLQWMFDFGAALNTARQQNKKVMVFFTAAGNRAAQTYETQYFMDPSVRQALSKYVLVKVDFPKNTRMGYSLGVFGAGIIVVTDATGDVKARIVQKPPTPLDLVRQMAGVKPAQTSTAASGTTAAQTSTP